MTFDAWMSLPHGVRKGLRLIDRDDPLGTKPANQFCCERAGTAAHIEDAAEGRPHALHDEHTAWAHRPENTLTHKLPAAA